MTNNLVSSLAKYPNLEAKSFQQLKWFFFFYRNN